MGQVIEKTYFHNLDATRFIGFLHVFTAHCFFTSNPELIKSSIYQFFQYNIRAGFLGLDYFFVLSSFLLTWIILEERKITGQFKAIYFLIRRALRLWPSYFLIVLCTYLAVSMAQVWGLHAPILPPIQVFLFFHANYFFINHGQDYLYLLVFLWVISVEEQFYFFWAFAMKYLSQYFHWLIATLIASSVLFRYSASEQESNLWFNTLSVLGNFAIGAWAAWLVFYSNRFKTFIQQLPKWGILMGYLIYVPIVYFYFSWANTPLGIAFEKLIFSFLFVFIILEQSFAQNSHFKLGKFKAINYLGRISLGLYCYHGVVITFYRKWVESIQFNQTEMQVFVFNPLIILALTIGIAVLSYELFEKHVYRWRMKFY
jgi:peptidoglycan/LPS O-acetylase OafA/YrhL